MHTLVGREREMKEWNDDLLYCWSPTKAVYIFMDRCEYTTAIVGLYSAEIRHSGGDSGINHQHFPT
jgi:hypothetical protein